MIKCKSRIRKRDKRAQNKHFFSFFFDCEYDLRNSFLRWYKVLCTSNSNFKHWYKIYHLKKPIIFPFLKIFKTTHESLHYAFVVIG